jgi:hypothetical protein
MSTPSVGRVVHYVSYGTPSGEYSSECRAAIITETDEHPERVSQRSVGLCVLNPTGMFFNQGVEFDPGGERDTSGSTCDQLTHNGGTWHWPARVA